MTPPPARRRLPALLAFSAAAHAAGAAGAALAPDRWPWVAGALAANHLAVVAAGLWPRSGLLGPNLTRLPDAAARRGEVALSFDDGPDPEVTPRVLDLLDEASARASFFCVGRRAGRSAGIVREIARRGHLVENHTDTHPNGFFFLGPGRIGREIDRAQQTIGGLTGRPPAFFRAPAGIRSPLLDPLLARRGLTLVSWTRRGFDTVSADPARVARRLGTGLAAGDLLLLHDGSCARAASGRPVILEVLPRLLEEMAARSLRGVPVSTDDAAEPGAP